MVLVRTPRDAEAVAAQWLQAVGFIDAALTPGGADGGIDVKSSFAIGQVKAEVKPVGRPAVQQTLGIALASRRMPFFFALGGYTAGAQRYAERHGAGLLRFGLNGEPEPVTTYASNMLAPHVRPCVENLYNIDWETHADIPSGFSIASDDPGWSALAVALEQALAMDRDTSSHDVELCAGHDQWVAAFRLSLDSGCGPEGIEAKALRIVGQPDYFKEHDLLRLPPAFFPNRDDGLFQPSIGWNTADIPPRLIAAGGVRYLQRFVALRGAADAKVFLRGALPGMNIAT